MKDQHELDRREFIRTAAAAGAGIALTGHASTSAHAAGRGAGHDASASVGRAGAALFRAPPIETVRVGFVGVGHQGTATCANFLKHRGRRDPRDLRHRARQGRAHAAAASSMPAGRARGVRPRPEDYIRMCEEEELDLVFTATPWECTRPCCSPRCARQARGDRDPARRHARRVLGAGRDRRADAAALRDDGELLLRPHRDDDPEHGAQRPARRAAPRRVRLPARPAALKLTDFYEGRWRVAHSIERNGDLYPTHGLGPSRSG
jgi:hypothetical protein